MAIKFTSVHRSISENASSRVISEYNTPKEMLQILQHAIIGHKGAYEKCGVLHEDIGVHNVRIDGFAGQKSHGVLVDWDFSASAKEKVQGKNTSSKEPCMGLVRTREAKPPRPHRVGTWAYMPIETLLRNPSGTPTLQDCLESFTWLAIHLGLKYQEFTLDDDLPGSLIVWDCHDHATKFGKVEEHIFTEWFLDYEDGKDLGGSGKLTAIIRETGDLQHLDFTSNTPLTHWTFDCLAAVYDVEVCKRNYRKGKARAEIEEVDSDEYLKKKLARGLKTTRLYNHDWMVWRIGKALQEEGWTDGKFQMQKVANMEETC